MKWRPRSLLQWGALGLLIGVGLPELVLRYHYSEQLRWRSFPHIYEPDEDTGYRYIAGSTGHLCMPSICRPVQINEGAYIGPYTPKHRVSNQTRIAIVSDCEGTGFWMARGKSYVQQLSEDLEGCAEVLNFSMDGDLFDLEKVERALKEVLPYKPDAVLLLAQTPFILTNIGRKSYRNYVVNYATDNPGSLERAKASVDYIESHRVLIKAYQVSYVVRAIARVYAGRSRSLKAQLVGSFIRRQLVFSSRPVPLSMKASMDKLAMLKERIRLVGGELYSMGHRGFPSLGIPHIDIKIAFPLKDPIVHEHDGHFNELGHTIIANKILPQLVSAIPELQQCLSGEKIVTTP